MTGGELLAMLEEIVPGLREAGEEPEPKPEPKYRNVLVMYQGGGYDGCFWEWNFAYFDSKGDFHCIFASGVAGKKTEEGVLGVISDDDTELYRFNDPDEIKRFGSEVSVSRLIGVGQWLAFDPEISDKVKLTAICEKCECEVDVAGEEPEGGCHGVGCHSEGGIVLEYDGLIFQQCHDNASCAYCGEYVGSEEIDSETGYCTGAKHEEWCLERHGEPTIVPGEG